MVHDLPAGGRRLVQRATGYRATLVAGGRYWLEQQHSGLASLTSRLVWIDEAAARERSEGCAHRALTAVPGHEHVPPPVPFARALVALR